MKVKIFIEGGYTYGRPDYGRVFMNGREVYICDYNIPLKVCLKRALKYIGIKKYRVLKRKRFSDGWEFLVEIGD